MPLKTENKKLNDLIAIIQRVRPQLVQQYKVESLGLFGSYLRHEQEQGSDLDLLITFHESPSLLKFIELENYLSDMLGIKVDLVMKSALKPGIGSHILKEVRPL